MHEYEQKYIKEAFDSNWVSPLGKNVDEFEKECAKYVGIQYAAALASGTSALHLASILSNVQKDDIVFASDETFAATVNPITYCGGNLVFIDSETETWNMDPKALRKAFEKYPNTKVVVMVHLYGTPAKIDEIREICDEHHAILIEDAAESMGATFKGKQTGTFGKYGIFSFNGNKIITTSGGGMLVSNDEEKIKKARFYATQAREKERHYEHKEIGYNYRMSNIVAGIGRGQLKYIDEHIKLKKHIYETYKEAFKDIKEIQMNPYLSDTEPNFWLSCIYLTDTSKVTPLMIMEALEKENIESRPIWKPMHMQPVYQGHDYITVGKSVSEDIFKNGVCLPSDIKNTKEDMQRIINCIRGLFNV